MFLTTNEDTAPRKKKRKRRKRRVSFFKVFLLLLFITIFAGGIAVGGYTLYVVKNAEPIDPTRISEMLDDTSFIYDSQGNLLEKVTGRENRTVVPIEQMPQSLKEAIVAIEDERFYFHNGVDVKRVFGAL